MNNIKFGSKVKFKYKNSLQSNGVLIAEDCDYYIIAHDTDELLTHNLSEYAIRIIKKSYNYIPNLDSYLGKKYVSFNKIYLEYIYVLDENLKCRKVK